MATSSRSATGKQPRRRKNSFDRLNKALDGAIEGMIDDHLQMLAGYKVCDLHRLVLHRVEKKLLEHILQCADFNQMRAADMLGISRSTLRSKIRLYGIKIRQKKAPSVKKNT